MVRLWWFIWGGDLDVLTYVKRLEISLKFDDLYDSWHWVKLGTGRFGVGVCRLSHFIVYISNVLIILNGLACKLILININAIELICRYALKTYRYVLSRKMGLVQLMTLDIVNSVDTREISSFQYTQYRCTLAISFHSFSYGYFHYYSTLAVYIVLYYTVRNYTIPTYYIYIYLMFYFNSRLIVVFTWFLLYSIDFYTNRLLQIPSIKRPRCTLYSSIETLASNYAFDPSII